MAKSEDGEFELILGNRQLVSVFLIVVILLGVFFSMGYIVGRNSSTAVASNTPVTDTPPKQIVVENLPPKQDAAPPSSTETAKPSPLPPAEPKKEEAKKEALKKEEASAARPPVSPASDEPRSGQTFLQVVASSHADCEIVAESLAKKSFRTMIAPGPNGLFRVLVGPMRDVVETTETRVRLEAAGFKPIVRKY